MNNLVNISHKDDNDSTSTTQFVNIEVFGNGYTVNITDDEGESKLVFSYEDREKMMKVIKESLGV